MPWRKTVVIFYSCTGLKVNMISLNQEQNIFLFIPHHTGKFWLSLSSFSDAVGQLLCWHCWSLPLCQSAQLFTFSSCRRRFVVFVTAGKVLYCPSAPLIYVVQGVWWINIKTRPPHWLPAITGWLVSCVGLDCLPCMGFWDGEASGVAIQGRGTWERTKKRPKKWN